MHICSLPDDLLSTIFFALSDIDPPHSPHARKYEVIQADLGWIKATHVCRRWRLLALDLAALWAAGVQESLGRDALLVFIRRARAAPLNFKQRADSLSAKRLTAAQFDLAHQNIQRSRSFVHVWKYSWRSVFKAGVVYPDLVELATELCNIDSSLEDDAFSSSTPIFPSLRSLTFEEASSYPPHLLAVLENTPRLRHLTIRRILLNIYRPSNAADNFVQSYRSKHIALSHLSSLVLEGSAAECVALWRCLGTPVNIAIAISIQLLPGQWSELRDDLSYITRAQQLHRPFDTLALHGIHRFGTYGTIAPNSLHDVRFTLSNSHDCNVTFSLAFPATELVSILTDMLTCVDATQIITFDLARIGAVVEVDASTLSTVLTPFLNVSVLMCALVTDDILRLQNTARAPLLRLKNLIYDASTFLTNASSQRDKCVAFKANWSGLLHLLSDLRGGLEQLELIGTVDAPQMCRSGLLDQDRRTVLELREMVEVVDKRVLKWH